MFLQDVFDAKVIFLKILVYLELQQTWLLV